MNGKFIVIEGTDCSGKETQTKLLVEKLNREGQKAIRLTYPMYDTPTGKIVGGCYLGKEEIGPSLFSEGASKVDPAVSSLYFAADRKYNLPTLRKFLEDGYFVICDRYTSSNMAHQGGKIEDPDERFNMYNLIDKLEYWLLKLPKADMTIFLHVPYEYAKELMKNRTSLDGHECDEHHLRNAEVAYIELSKLYNWDTINCIDDRKIRSIDSINEEIIEKVKRRYNITSNN